MTNIVIWRKFRSYSVSYEDVERMVDLSMRSCQENLAGNWKPVVLEDDHSGMSFLDGYREMTGRLLGRLRGHYEKGDNVLYLDADVLCVRPTEIFGRFSEMRLFWHTDPSSSEEFDPYLNGGVAYFPASMPGELWDTPEPAQVAEWAEDQDYFNAMFHTQRPLPELHPELNWSAHVPSTIPREEAHFLHFHSTRGHALERMEEALEPA